MYQVLKAGLILSLLANGCVSHQPKELSSEPQHPTSHLTQADNPFPDEELAVITQTCHDEVQRFYDWLQETGQLVNSIDPTGLFNPRELDGDTLEPIEWGVDDIASVEDIVKTFEELAKSPEFLAEWAKRIGPPT